MINNKGMDKFSALSDPTRRAIVERLAASGELSAGDIGARFDVSPPAISQHLKVLREAGLVRVEKSAQQRIYSVEPAGLRELQGWLESLQQFWEDKFDALEDFLKDDEVKARRKIYKPNNLKPRRRK